MDDRLIFKIISILHGLKRSKSQPAPSDCPFDDQLEMGLLNSVIIFQLLGF